MDDKQVEVSFQYSNDNFTNKDDDKLISLFNNFTNKYDNAFFKKETAVDKFVTIKNLKEAKKLQHKSLKFKPKARIDYLKEAKRLNEERTHCNQINRGENCGKNKIIMRDVKKLFFEMDEITTGKNSLVKTGKINNGLLNSHKDFIVMKKFADFQAGVPLLKIKQEDFKKKMELFTKKDKLPDFNKNQIKLIQSSVGTDTKRPIYINDMLKKVRVKNKSNNIFATELNGFNDWNTIYQDPKEEKGSVPPTKEREKILANVPREMHKLVKIKEIDSSLLPNKVENFTKVRIRDMLDLPKIVKPVFKV